MLYFVSVHVRLQPRLMMLDYRGSLELLAAPLILHELWLSPTVCTIVLAEWNTGTVVRALWNVGALVYMQQHERSDWTDNRLVTPNSHKVGPSLVCGAYLVAFEPGISASTLSQTRLSFDLLAYHGFHLWSYQENVSHIQAARQDFLSAPLK